ncbi:MAG: thioredoxin domain-containing protein [Sulfurospirillum sp.]|nr:thioredoxin domain-containing protein [Sulfurospirillum sp.]
MKKTVSFLSILAFSSSLFAASDAQIVEYFKSQIPVPNIKIEVTSRSSIEQIKDMDYVSLNISDGSRSQKMSVFTQGDLIFPDVISINDGGSIKEKLDKAKFMQELAKVYKNEDAKNILIVGNDANKPTLIEFTDPECPFCNKELQAIEEKLKNYNLKLIFTPVHDRSSLEKSVLIYKQTNAIEDTAEKIKILRKYYNGDVDAKVSDEEVDALEKLRQKYFTAGLKGVPLYVPEADLLK